MVVIWRKPAQKPMLNQGDHEGGHYDSSGVNEGGCHVSGKT